MFDENSRRAFLRNAGLVSLSALGVGSGLASAKSQSAIQTLPPEYRPGADGVTVLTPKAGSKQSAKAANLAAVLMVEKDDGGYKQVVAGRGDRSLEFNLEVDFEAKTYEVTDLEFINPAEAQSTDTSSSDGQKHTVSSGGLDTEVTSTYGPYTVQITTHDPVECKLCRTKQTLEWSHDTNTASTYVSSRDYTGAWWDPTGCGTNWHHDYTNWVDQYSSTDKCYTECEGQYYCDNFQDDNKRTFSYHKVHNTGYSDGTKDYWATADHSGEGSSYLHTHVRLV